jgi:hypothetical protein
VFVSAASDIRTAGDKRFKSFVAGLEVIDLDVESFVLEITPLLRDREREIGDQNFAADGQAQVRLFEISGVRGKYRSQQCEQRRVERVLHDLLPGQRRAPILAQQYDSV